MPNPKAVTIQPYSEPNVAVAPSILLAKQNISSIYAGSKVASFDMKSIAHGCFIQGPARVTSPAFGCTVRYVGTKAGSGKQEIFDAAFNVTKRNIYGFAAGPEKVQVVEFPATFDGLTSVEPSIWKPANLRATEGSLVQMAFDEVTYTAHVREDA